MILHNYEDDDDNDGYYCDIHTYVCMLVSTLSHKPNVCTYVCTVEPVYKDHPGDQENMVSINRWSSYRGVVV